VGFNNFDKFPNLDKDAMLQQLKNMVGQDPVELLLRDSTAVKKQPRDPFELLLKNSTAVKEPKKEVKEQINLQDLFNGLKEKHGNKIEEEKKPELSPKSKRMAAWDLEDSFGDSEPEFEEEYNFPSTCLC
jgi:hypothetical protein